MVSEGTFVLLTIDLGVTPVDLFTAASSAYASGATVGAAVGLGAIALGVATKVVQDRMGRRATATAGTPSMRSQARAQLRQLDGRVAAGVPAGGQFAAHQRHDADVELS